MAKKEYPKRPSIKFYFIFWGIVGTLVLISRYIEKVYAAYEIGLNFNVSVDLLVALYVAINTAILYWAWASAITKEKIVIDDTFLAHVLKKNKNQIKWQKIEKIKVVKSFDYQRLPYQSPAEIFLWKIIVSYQDTNTGVKTLELLKNQFKNQDSMLCELVRKAKVSKIPVDIKDYLTVNPQFKNRCNCI
ncbi:MAG: hypothetical protein WCW26_00515 [Candidatus Buchananbacteria bacterium]